MADDGDLYTVGEVARVDGRFTTDAGDPADPSSLVFRYQNTKDSIGTFVFGTDADLKKDGVGQFHVDLPVTEVADWQWRWIATGVVATAGEGGFRSWSQFDGDASLYTYDLATPVGRMRLALDDRDLSQVSAGIALEKRSAVWSDGELGVFLEDAGGSVPMAISSALQVLANNRSLLVQSRRIGETTVDYGPIRADLLRQAEAFRQDAYRIAPGEPADGYAEVAWTEFSARRIVTNGILRREL